MTKCKVPKKEIDKRAQELLDRSPYWLQELARSYNWDPASIEVTYNSTLMDCTFEPRLTPTTTTITVRGIRADTPIKIGFKKKKHKKTKRGK